MEIIETCQTFKPCVPCPTIECSRKYVQPPRIESFAPKKAYCRASIPLDSRTTYLSSYFKGEQQTRRKPIIPVNAININCDKFANETATKMSYLPIVGIHKAKAIIPRRRPNMFCGPMENVTTIRHDYPAKICNKTEPIVPCNNICTSNVPLEVNTTTNMSYIKPEAIEQLSSFRPLRIYKRPETPILHDTTQKMSYMPVKPQKKEYYAWAQKPIYRPPDVMMPCNTTYTTSYFENKEYEKQGMIVPKGTCLFPLDEKQLYGTIYKQSYFPRPSAVVEPIIPCPNIVPSGDKMEVDTTTKMSYQPVPCEKTKPIIPRKRHLIGDHRMALEQLTVNRLEYTKKPTRPRKMIIPCNSICTKDVPLETYTTTSLSFPNPGPQEIIASFKPQRVYCRPVEKIESDTMNQLSFQAWTIQPKEEHPWKPKGRYCPPQEKMVDGTIYQDSYPAPGYYVEVCEPVECQPGAVCCDSPPTVPCPDS